MSAITTHILDTSLGKPAKGVPIRLEIADGDTHRLLGQGETDDDGRLKTLLGEHDLWRESVFFEEALRVPLLVHVPDALGELGKPGPCSELVELLSLSCRE